MPSKSSGNGEQGGLGHAPAVASRQHAAGTHAVWRQVDLVRVVAKRVAHREVERHGALPVVVTLRVVPSERAHLGVVAVDQWRAGEVLGVHGRGSGVGPEWARC